MNLALLFIGLAIVFMLSFIIMNREKKTPVMINQIDTEKAVFSFFETNGKKMLQTLFKSDEPELFSVYVTNKAYERTIQGKGSIKKLYQNQRFVHYANPAKKISKVVKIETIDLPDNYNPFRELTK
jgi:predicted RecB family nuclease